MSAKPRQLQQKVMQWLNEEYPDADVQLIPNDTVLFQIDIKDKEGEGANLPMHIFILRNKPDRLVIEIYWQLSATYNKSITWLKADAKTKFLKQLKQGFILMHLNFATEPDSENLERVKIQTHIILDGLTKHTLVESLFRVSSGHAYILSLIDLIMDQRSDSSHKS